MICAGKGYQANHCCLTILEMKIERLSLYWAILNQLVAGGGSMDHCHTFDV
jgi:hypothetical protein